MLSSGQSIPKAGLLVLVPNLINTVQWRPCPEEKGLGSTQQIGCVCWECALHLWGAQDASDPRVGAGGVLSTGQVPYTPCSAMSSCGVPGLMRRPASGKSWHFCSGPNKGALRAFPLQSAEAAREDDEVGLSQSSIQVTLRSEIEEGAVSLLRSEGLGQFGEPVYSFIAFAFCMMTWRLPSSP